MKNVGLIVCLFLGLTCLSAQTSLSFEEVKKNYGLEFVYAHTVTIDGGVALLCKSDGNDKKCMLLKLDNSGNKEWIKVLSGVCIHDVYTLNQKANGCYLVEGNSYFVNLGAMSENYIEKPVVVELSVEGDFKRAKVLDIALLEF